jgi:hypothetical protein
MSNAVSIAWMIGMAALNDLFRLFIGIPQVSHGVGKPP